MIRRLPRALPFQQGRQKRRREDCLVKPAGRKQSSRGLQVFRRVDGVTGGSQLSRQSIRHLVLEDDG